MPTEKIFRSSVPSAKNSASESVETVIFFLSGAIIWPISSVLWVFICARRPQFASLAVFAIFVQLFRTFLESCKVDRKFRLGIFDLEFPARGKKFESNDPFLFHVNNEAWSLQITFFHHNLGFFCRTGPELRCLRPSFRPSFRHFFSVLHTRPLNGLKIICSMLFK